MKSPVLLRRLAGRARGAAADLVRRVVPGPGLAPFAQRPYELHLELTNLCNANCVFCPYERQARAHEFMPESVFTKAVAEFAAMGGGPVVLTPTVGDPLVHRDFVPWVRRLRAIPQVGRITATTNAILLQRHGVDQILSSGISALNISTAGFDEAMYRRVYRSHSYRQFRDGVYRLYEANARRKEPIALFLLLRPDRPAADVLADPDLQPLLAYQPHIEVIEEYSRSGGLMTALPEGMPLAAPVSRGPCAPCGWTYSGLVVLSSGEVQVCACESTVNAPALRVGHLQDETLSDIWHGDKVAAIRQSFLDGRLNANCRQCDYYDPVAPDSPEWRRRARVLRRRERGETPGETRPLTRPFQVE